MSSHEFYRLKPAAQLRDTRLWAAHRLTIVFIAFKFRTSLRDHRSRLRIDAFKAVHQFGDRPIAAARPIDEITTRFYRSEQSAPGFVR